MPDHTPPADALENRSMPPGSLIPELVYADMEAAVAWLVRAFGFAERLRIGQHRTQLLVGPAAAIVAVQRPAAAAATSAPSPVGTHSLMVRVADVDQHFARARQACAQIVQAPQDFPYGERQYTVDDPDGHRWTFTQSVADVDPATWGGVLLESAAPRA